MVQFGPLGILNVCCFAGVLGGGMLKMKGFVSECNQLCYTLEGMLLTRFIKNIFINLKMCCDIFEYLQIVTWCESFLFPDYMGANLFVCRDMILTRQLRQLLQLSLHLSWVRILA
jgi:hypothetical protein